jgi:hypothetical protein
LGFIEIATPASCNGVLVTFGVRVDEALAEGVALAVPGVVVVEAPVCAGVVHALKFRPSNVASKSITSKRRSIVTPWFR